jgi:uncharacterized damage-inducible protein DinB
MSSAALLTDAFGRVQEIVHAAMSGVTAEHLVARIDADANTIAWLVWHLTRVQDDHIAGVAGTEQLWTSEGWYERFGLPFGAESIGYGHSSAQVAQVRVEPAGLLTEYQDAVHDRTVEFLRGLEEEDLATVVDRSWDPPVTMGVRLVSVVSDTLQHAGQAAFVRGVLTRTA